MKQFLFVLLFCLAPAALFGLEKQVAGPDGKLVVTLSDEGGLPTYRVSFNGKPFLLKSPLGLKSNVGDFSQELVMKEEVALNPIDES